MSSPLHVDKPRACPNCSRAKAKCVWPATDDEDSEQTCQRCLRNSLACSKPHSLSKRRRGKANQSKVIEQKLDNIMALLSQERNRPIESPSSLPSNGFTPAAIQAPHQDIRSTPLHTPASYPSQDAFINIVPGFQISFIEADQVLQEYTAEMLPQFPFVPLPSLDAYEMYKRKPLLLKTILWVCRPPGPEAYGVLENWFRQHVAYQTVVLMNKSLEIVQALLVYFAWNDIFFFANSKDTSLLQLAIGLLADLGLYKRPSTTNPAFVSIVDDAADLRNDLQPQPGHSSDDRRAALGVYYIASIRCSIFGKLSGVEYTPRLDDCARQLLQDQEHPTDLLLVNLVRIRQIAIKVNDVFGNTGDHPIAEKTSTNVRAIVVASIRNELDTYISSLPEHLQSNYLLRSHCAAVRIRLLEPVNHGNRHDPLEPTHLRCRAMWDCLESTQALIDAFLLIPIESYPSLTFVPILHLALAIIKALRLLCVEDQAWDLHTAQTMYNLPDILQRLSKLFEEASRIGRPRCGIMVNDRPMLCEYAGSYKAIEHWYLNKVGVAHSDLMDSVVGHDGDQFKGFDFWNQLSDLTYGLGP